MQWQYVTKYVSAVEVAKLIPRLHTSAKYSPLQFIWAWIPLGSALTVHNSFSGCWNLAENLAVGKGQWAAHFSHLAECNLHVPFLLYELRLH